MGASGSLVSAKSAGRIPAPRRCDLLSVLGFGFWVLGFGVWGVGFEVLGLGFGV